MDVVDRKIMAELMNNGRLPVAQLAKKVGTSREVAQYRLKRLQTGIIRHSYAIINYSKIGYSRYIFFMQWGNKNEEEMLDYLNNHPFVTYMGPLIGKWDVAFDLIVKDENQLKTVVGEIMKKTQPTIYGINGTGIEEGVFPTKFVGIVQDEHVTTKHHEYKVDEHDKTILHTLSTNGRSDYVTLGKKTGLAANTIKYRIKQMEKAGIIEGYTISINYRSLGWEWYNIQIKTGMKQDEKIVAYAKNHPNTVYYYRHFGRDNWDMDLGIIAKSTKELKKTITQIKQEFPHIVIYDMYIIEDVIKDNILPSGCLT